MFLYLKKVIRRILNRERKFQENSLFYSNSSAQDFAPAAKSVRMRKGLSGIRPFAVWQTLNERIP